MGYVVRQTLSTELSPAPKNVTSMINLKMVASPADPKNDSISSSEVLSLEPSYKEKHVVHLTEKVCVTLCSCCSPVPLDTLSQSLTEGVSFGTVGTNLSWLYLRSYCFFKRDTSI